MTRARLGLTRLQDGSEQCSADMIIGALTMEKERGQCLHDGAMDATMTKREAMNATMQTQWCHDEDKGDGCYNATKTRTTLGVIKLQGCNIKEPR